MSGTSLDGIDIAACKFWLENEQWKYEIIKAETYNYSAFEINVLKNAFNLTGVSLVALHHHYGNLIGEKVNEFCKKYQIKPDYIASHGHTIFHQPENSVNFFNNEQSNNAQTTNDNSNDHNSRFNGFTFQLGHGANIAAMSGVKTICDFRTSDVAYGGQGAPLVPIGDELLFQEYDFCLNLGGISNISFKQDKVRKAFDIGICNMALNELAQELNFNFDKDGLLAGTGVVEVILLSQLQEASQNHQLKKQSLGYEWYDKHIKPILSNFSAPTINKLCTYCEFIAWQIAALLTDKAKVLVTGGGAKNKFLMACIQNKTKANILIPDELTIDFKEALIFAFLGMLRVDEQPNSFKAVTGAKINAKGGCIYLP